MTEAPPRIAFLTDCFHEVNGVALTSRQLDAFARRHDLPFLSVHVGPQTREWHDGSVTTVELKRSPASVPLDAGMHFDTLCLRHLPRVKKAMQAFQPDIIHITGPGDGGLLGFILSLQLNIPLVASWHTNLHEFAARRLERMVGTVLPRNPTKTLGEGFRARHPASALALLRRRSHPTGAESRVDRNAGTAHQEAGLPHAARH